ncbi:MAG: hypothetical protein RLZZ507_311 [Cyanobacteriota bacterium]
MKFSQLKNIILCFISWFGWLAYIIWSLCYLILMISVGVVILIIPIIAYIFFAITSVMSRLVLGAIGIGDNYTNYNSQFELTPSDSIGYTLTKAITSIVRFIFKLIFVLPLKLFIGSYTGMSMETPIAEIPGYILESISYLRPPHRFSFYSGIISFPLIIAVYFYFTKT